MGKQSRKERGGVLIEIILSLPLFLLCVFILMWVGFTYSSKTALISAVNNGARLALTRGQIELVREDVILDVTTWDGSQYEIFRDFFMNQYNGTPQEALVDYNTLLSAPMFFPYGNEIDVLNITLQDASDTYRYALVYVQESLKRAVGSNGVRYPCDPRAAGGAGCLRCVFEDLYQDGTYDPRKMVIHCEYQPDTVLIRPIRGLLQLVAGEPFVLYHAYYAN